jgi:hypothetical protein
MKKIRAIVVFVTGGTSECVDNTLARRTVVMALITQSINLLLHNAEALEIIISSVWNEIPE